MFGLIGRMRAHPGRREELEKLLLAGIEAMPGCLSYVVARDPEDADALWITEVWMDEEKHKASLSLPTVKETISQAMPLIAGFDSHHRTQPIGGVGI